MIANILVNIVWLIYLYRNIITAIFYFMYYDVDNKILKIFLLMVYSFSDEMTSFLFLVEYARIFLTMNIIKCINVYKYVKLLEYYLLSGIIYPYYGTFMLNTSSKVLEFMMMIFLFDLYNKLNHIVYMRVYSKYKKTLCCCNNNVYKKKIELYYYKDYIKQEISEYYDIKSQLDKYCVYVLIFYTLSIISYNMWIYTFYLYYISLMVKNYYMLDKLLSKNTKIKENEKNCHLCDNK